MYAPISVFNIFITISFKPFISINLRRGPKKGISKNILFLINLYSCGYKSQEFTLPMGIKDKKLKLSHF